MNGTLLDTSVISELTKPTPHPGVVGFLSDLDRAWVSVLTLHELHYGLIRLPEGYRRAELEQTIDRFVAAFDDAILAITRPEALEAAELRSTAERQGRVMHIADALIAGTALAHGLTLATRNVNDFAGFGISIVNPWQG